MYWFAPALAHDFQVWRVLPGDTWCDSVAAVGPGDIVEFVPGVYPGPCVLTVGGIVEKNEALLLRSADLARPATILVPPDGIGLVVGSPIVRLYALAFEGSGSGVGVVSLSDGLTVQATHFSGLASGVLVTLGPSPGTSLLDNSFERVSAPIRTFGPGPVVVRGALVEGWSGTAIDVTGTGTVFDNVVGPGVGTAIRSQSAEVSSNVILGATIGIDGGGPIRRNAVVAAPIQVRTGGEAFGNTVIDGVITGPSRSNVIVGEAGPYDVACTSACFVNLAGLDLTPTVGSGLIGAGPADAGPDLCDRSSDRPALGATDGPGPHTLDVRPLAELCAIPPGPDVSVALTRRCGGDATVGLVCLWTTRRRRPKGWDQRRTERGYLSHVPS